LFAVDWTSAGRELILEKKQYSGEYKKERWRDLGKVSDCPYGTHRHQHEKLASKGVGKVWGRKKGLHRGTRDVLGLRKIEEKIPRSGQKLPQTK